MGMYSDNFDKLIAEVEAKQKREEVYGFLIGMAGVALVVICMVAGKL